MPIQIGAKPEGSFKEPLVLLSDCHRRIERFLEQLIAVTERSAESGRIDASEREPLETALRYFKRAAPLHTEDEENSLFPRMRAAGGADALAVLDRLEADHVEADRLHLEVDRLGVRWLAEGRLEMADLSALAGMLRSLREIYRGHIAVEDNEVFPRAAELLEPQALATVGREMAARRGLDPDNLPGPGSCHTRKAGQIPLSA